MNDPLRFILSGDREIGKTSLLLKLIDEAARFQINAGGVISPAVFVDGKKTAIDLLEVRNHALCRLADLNQGHASSNNVTEHWAFHPDSLELGNDFFAKSIPCDLLIVDELGPIELERGQGWQNGIAAIDSQQYRVAVIVIRLNLLENALHRWPDAQILTLQEKTDSAQEILIKTILSSLLKK